MFCCGSGVAVPSAPRSNSMKTRFQNSRKRSQRSQLGPQVGSPQPCSAPRSRKSSEQGPQGPVSAACQKFSERGWPTIRSRGSPTRSQPATATSSSPRPSAGSPANTVAQRRSGSKPMWAVTNSQANAIASSLK